MSVAAIVLAAGGSTRMGTPKQLLDFQGESFLHRSISAAADAGCSPIVVVLGSNADQIKKQVDPTLAKAVLNPKWQAGMGGSIHAGIAQIKIFPAVHAALIMLCDQPLIDAPALRQLLTLANDPTKTIIATNYGGSPGVPAIFPRRFFPTLEALPVSSGAKQLLIAHAAEIKMVTLDAAALDIDTPEDFENLQSTSHQ